MLHPLKIKAIRAIVSKYFKNAKGEPYILSDGQCEIFYNVLNPDEKWVWVSAPTRYGKTDIIAMALIYLAVFYHLKIPVVAGSMEKANKIMEYVVQHLADHPDFYDGLINLDLSDVESLKVKMTKEVIRWVDGGWIYVTSIDARNTVAEGEGVVGEGGDVILLEEAGLIKRDEQFSKVVRMAEEDKGWGKMIMSGNCVEGSVFEKAFNNPLYKKVRITLEQSVNEGRYTWKALEEKKTQTTTKDWKRYYLVEFPLKGEFAYFKRKLYEVLPNDLKYYGAFDPALGDIGKNNKDESKKKSLLAVVVLGVDSKGQVYECYNYGSDDVGPDDVVTRIFNLPFKFERFAIEAIQFQKYFLKTIDERSKALGKYIPFEALEQKENKNLRIESLEPHINTGHILFSGEGLLEEHLSEYPKLEQLDVLDTLEMAWRLIYGSNFSFFIAD